MRKLGFGIVLAVMVALLLLSGSAMAADVVKSGQAGECTWTLYSDHSLVFSGTGKVYQWQPDNIDDSATVEKIIFEEGVSAIGRSSTYPIYLTSMRDASFADMTSVKEIVFPSTLKKVDAHDLFKGCTALETVVLPEGISVEGNGMFSDCQGIRAISFPTEWDNWCIGMFEGCTGLKSVEVQGSDISSDMFEYCTGLETVKIKQGIRSVKNGGFRGCPALKSIEFSTSVYDIDSYAFYDSPNIQTIRFQGLPPQHEVNNYGLFFDCAATVYYPDLSSWENEKNYLGKNLTFVAQQPDGTITHFSGTLDNLTWDISTLTGLMRIGGYGDMNIQTGFNDLPVGNEYDYAVVPWEVYKTSITKVVIENGVTSIGIEAFSGCSNLTEVEFPSSIASIGTAAFKKCINLKNGLIPDGTLNVREDVYYGCKNLESIEIPEGVQTIGNGAFAYCAKLKRVVIPDSVKSIIAFAFEYSGLEDVVLGKNVELIGYRAFYGTKIKTICIPASVEKMESDALYGIDDVTFDGDVPLIWNGSSYGHSTIHEVLGVYLWSTDEPVFPTVHYPADNHTWDESVAVDMTDWQSAITWVPYSDEMKVNISDCSVDLSPNSFVYDGTAKTPEVTVTYGDIELLLNNDYTISFDNNVNAGSAVATVTGMGNYEGSATLAYEIVKAKPVLLFESNSLSKKIGDADFTNPLTAETDGSLTYSSSNKAVAEVNAGTGLISLKGEGTAVVTVESGEGINYTAGQASFSLAVLQNGFELTFDANGGTVAIASKAVTNGSAYGDLPTPIWSNYRFDGWFTSANGGTQITSDTSVNLTANQTLYAHWTRIYSVTYNSNGGTGTPLTQTKEENVPLTLSNLIPSKGHTVLYNAAGGIVTPASKNVSCTFVNWNTATTGGGDAYASGGSYTANADVTLYAQWTNPAAGTLATPTRSGHAFEGWFTSAEGGTKITESTTVTENMTIYAHWTDPYDLGDETYSFENYSDSDSCGGHCFGMSMTSAGYHIGALNIRRIGGSANTPLYSFDRTATVKAPICYYQGIQEYSARATVAGGSFYLYGYYNITQDWQEVVSYVRNHAYDNTGLLQIGFRKRNEGGHAINFLRYENVNGQDRIYTYDNNFPRQETYFYCDSSGNVWQAPIQTFSGTIDCIALRDCRTYFEFAPKHDSTHALYMPKDSATVQGYSYIYLDGGVSGEEYVMYTIPADQDRVVIIPNKNNADFIYMDTEYSFGKITDETYGVLRFATLNEGAVVEDANFQIFEGVSGFGKPDLTLPESLTEIGESAFEGIPAMAIYVPDTCVSISQYAFRNAAVKKIRIPEGCSIADAAFDGCEAVQIFGTAGSAAETFCNTHSNCTFVAE